MVTEMKDPRVRLASISQVKLSSDLRSARVYVSVRGDEKSQALSMHGLRSARGFIQSRIADRLELRYTPILSFVHDPGVKLSAEASAIIREALASAANEPSAAGDAAAEEDLDDAAPGFAPDGEEESN